MSKFALKNIGAVTGTKHIIQQLEIDGVCQLDDFEANLESTFMGEFKSLLTWLDYHSKGGLLPAKKLRKLKTPKKDSIVEFEFRSTNLRLYAIQRPNGKVVVSCCYKKDQDKDLPKFRKLKLDVQPIINKL